MISILGGLFNGLKFGFLLLVLPIREILYYRKLINTNFNVCLKRDDVRFAMGLPVYNKKNTQENLKDDPSTSGIASLPMNFQKNASNINSDIPLEKRLKRRNGVFRGGAGLLN